MLSKFCRTIGFLLNVLHDNQRLTMLHGMKTLKSTKRNILKMQNEFNQNVEKELTMKQNYKEEIQVIRPYMDECMEICLLMNIEEPPMELQGRVLSCYPKFNLSAFKPYKHSRDIIEYILWPAMYLYRDGAVMCKGVAHYLSDSSNILNPSNVKQDNNEVNGQQIDPKGKSINASVPNDRKAET